MGAGRYEIRPSFLIFWHVNRVRMLNPAPKIHKKNALIMPKVYTYIN
jgi:hypothetical protein